MTNIIIDSNTQKQKNNTNKIFRIMEQEFNQDANPQISAELAKEISLECGVSIKGLKKSGIVEENDEFELVAQGIFDEMLNGIEQAICLIEDWNPEFKLTTLSAINSCTARERRKVCFTHA